MHSQCDRAMIFAARSDARNVVATRSAAASCRRAAQRRSPPTQRAPHAAARPSPTLQHAPDRKNRGALAAREPPRHARHAAIASCVAARPVRVEERRRNRCRRASASNCRTMGCENIAKSEDDAFVACPREENRGPMFASRLLHAMLRGDSAIARSRVGDIGSQATSNCDRNVFRRMPRASSDCLRNEARRDKSIIEAALR